MRKGVEKLIGPGFPSGRLIRNGRLLRIPLELSLTRKPCIQRVSLGSKITAFNFIASLIWSGRFNRYSQRGEYPLSCTLQSASSPVPILGWEGREGRVGISGC